MRRLATPGRCLLAAASLATSALAFAQAGTVLPGAALPEARIEQRPGDALPLDAAFVDAAGRPVRLGDYFAAPAAPRGRGVPVVVVFGYYRCPNLCETVMQTTLDALARSGADRDGYRVVAIGIDPAETPADARQRLLRDAAYADLAAARAQRGRAPEQPLRIDALIGTAGAVDRVARAAGFVFTREVGPGAAEPAAFAHAAGFLLVTPRGRVARWFLGLETEPTRLRAALAGAREESVDGGGGGGGNAAPGLVERFVLLCRHLDPSSGRHDAAVLLGLRIVGTTLAVLLLGWVWRHRAVDRRRSAP